MEPAVKRAGRSIGSGRTWERGANPNLRLQTTPVRRSGPQSKRDRLAEKENGVCSYPGLQNEVPGWDDHTEGVSEMKTTIRTILLVFAVVSLVGLMWAQQQRASPHESTSATISGKKITVEYGRPNKKGREIFGGLVPFDKVWRTGADEATKFTTEADLKVGDLSVPAGTYSLFTIPNEKEWTLVLNKVADQWGAFKYESGQDLGRTAMTVSSLDAPLEQFTIAIEAKGGSQATLKLSWDQTTASADITVQ